MPRECTVCSHEDAVLINEALVVNKQSNRRTAAQYGLAEASIRRHRQHIPQMLARASRAEEIAEGDRLLDRLEDLQKRTLAILEASEHSDEHRTALGAIREARSNLEVIGEVTKELNRAPTSNFHLNPQWIQLRTLIVTALEPHPEALDSVWEAIEATEGNGHERIR